MEYKIKNLVLPIIPLRGISIFPHMVIHFDVGREKSIKALEKAMLDESNILLSTQINPKIDEPSKDDFYEIGTVAKVKQMLKLPGGSIRVLVEGINRGRIREIIQEEEYFIGEIEELSYDPDEIEVDKPMEAAMRLVIGDLEEYIELNPKVSSEVLVSIDDIKDPGRLVDVIASYISLNQEDDQKILETLDLLERLEALHGILQQEIELLEIEEKINQRVKKQINKVQKEYYLREQLKAIQSELGEGSGQAGEIESYEEKIKKLKLPKEAKEKALEELKRLKVMSMHSSEASVIRTYLDLLLAMPWNRESKGKIDIVKAREILNEDHYGLEDVKERVLEFIAIRKLTNSMKGPIICLVGPPGVGKTSIAQSVAKALDRKFVRISLGGVKDEADIRGHRRTYIGSMPGRIISAIKTADKKNPVILLDEIDKVSSDYKGDPASALLEVLDPAQNNTFTDHFLDVPFDLSKVLFLTTANTINSIPRPLLDRMEVINIGGYTDEEKLEISKRYLLPKQVEAHGLGEENISISDEALKQIISNYTREAGVRNLERSLARVCRKSAKRIVEEDLKNIRINAGNLEKYLGKPRFNYDRVDKEDKVGVANGLAWTAVGGETLSIEVNIMAGTGKLQLTGKLGDVMKESAAAGISYIRANAEKLGIDSDFYKNYDIHIHVPEGAIPKDGPSAGITIATAVTSALTGKKIMRNVGMTGEITLRGRVLPVGGIKEKVLAGDRMGLEKIIMPMANKKDIEDIPEKIRKKIKFVFADSMDIVLEEALIKGNEKNENN